ncbi:MAG: hypothetical protein Q7N87_00825 [Candidatus Uhrbacteria bacterium]|nr:hypothetical protein [Candidatus Uhrbacteria bacterium]
MIRHLRDLGCWIERNEELDRTEKIDFTVRQIGELYLEPSIQVQVTFRHDAMSKAREFFSLAERRGEDISVYIEMPNLDSVRLTNLVRRILFEAYRDALLLEEPYFWVKIRGNGESHRWEGLKNIRIHLEELRLALNEETNPSRSLGWLFAIKPDFLISDVFVPSLQLKLPWGDTSPELKERLRTLLARPRDTSWMYPGQRLSVRFTPLRFVDPVIHYIAADVTVADLPQQEGLLVEVRNDTYFIETDDGKRYLAHFRDVSPGLLTQLMHSPALTRKSQPLKVQFRLVELPRHPTLATEVTLT